MTQFVEYTGKDILDLTDEEFARALLELGAEDNEPKPVNFDRLNEEYQRDRENYSDFELGADEDEEMTKEELDAFLDKEFPDYPKDTPDAYKEIGAENWWAAGLPDEVREPTELERAFALRLFVYEEKYFIRLGYVKEAKESEKSIKLRLRFIPAGRLPTEGPTELSVRVDKDESLKTIPEILGTGQQMLHFRPEYIQKILDGWHREWLV